MLLLGLAPVKTYGPQTSSGLHNMLGNVWEWVVEGNGKKRKDKIKGKSKPMAKNQRVLRGGSFVDSYVPLAPTASIMPEPYLLHIRTSLRY